MTSSTFWNQLLLFILTLIFIVAIREYISYQLITNAIESYQIHTWISTGANIVLTLFSLYFIKKNGHSHLAGIRRDKLRKWYILIFPLVYLVLLNFLLLDNIESSVFLSNVFVLMVYVISIGFAEELSIRGFLQSHIITFIGDTKPKRIFAITAAALFFGILHLINFDKGLYGEISQVFFATFIGMMFGVVLLITKRIYPLILIHACIDFVAKMDSAGLSIDRKIADPVTPENALLIVLLTFPCLLYATLLMWKFPLDVQTNKEIINSTLPTIDPAVK